MATSYIKTQPALSKDLWITSGIFSSHYLLERLPQAGAKIWLSDEENSQAHIKKFGSLDKDISLWELTA